ncbi:MAG: iron-sulfur cluster assembly protein, partial [Paracoccaceae bacterium]|nr:iron-sulfur cluster assembly protein [Paracoccaceae bacterium]
MPITRETVLQTLLKITLPGGGTLESQDLIRALTVDGGQIRFVIEAATPDQARSLAAAQQQAETALRALPGVTLVQVVMTAHGP